MARLKAGAAPPPDHLTLDLFDPGLGPVLRAGLGGLAATLAWLDGLGEAPVGGGSWDVTPNRVTLSWVGLSAPFLQWLFERAFSLRDGLIALPGAWGSGPPELEVHCALQDALRATILQHGKHAKKDGGAAPVTGERDQPFTVLVQRYASYTHQDQWAPIAAALDAPPGRSRPIGLAGWANPGAVQRHNAFAESGVDYTPAQALCACFALVGTLSYRAPRGGVLLAPVPGDLVAFARLRPRLTPKSLAEAAVGGASDAALSLQVALRMQDLADRDRRGAVARTLAWRLRPTAWASQQKSRVEGVDLGWLDPAALDAFAEVMASLPARVFAAKQKGDVPGARFAVPSALRAFVADNLADGRPWHHGFADARDPSDPDRRLHIPRTQDNKGALRRDEQEGLQRMITHLDEAEATLVRSVHTALRHRLGEIALQYKDNPQGMKNRWTREREQWRLAFAGARTHEQARFALADLWSRAGTVRELAASWEQILPLLREDRWQAARDLALVALASYAGRGQAGESGEIQYSVHTDDSE